jgi:ubiquinone/menaquinone biosynthesis C-methylase UbiE
VKSVTLSPPVVRPETREFAKLVTTGRVTGLPHIVIVRFTFHDGSFYVLAGRGMSDWAKNAIRAGDSRLRMDELVYEVAATSATEDERRRTVESFIQKYGSKVVKDWYSNPALCVKLTPLSLPSRRGAVRGESEAEMDFQAWKSQNLDYYRGVVDAFDSAAEEYDFTISQNFINRWIRQRSIQELLKLTNPEDTLLEIGCGTGAEAVAISRDVSKIVATDISERMIQILEKKVRAKKLRDRIIPFNVRASDISNVSSILGDKKIRIAYSFNGALNCEPALEHFPSELSKVMQEGGFFICSIRNTLCLSEAVLHALAFQFSRMAPRRKQPIMVSVGGKDIPSTYYSPSEFIRLFSPQFEIRRLIGLPAILPPAYLSDRYVRVRKVVGFVERIENILSSWFPLNRFGDQSLFVFQKHR